jgi:peptide/nickel transport system ATP-binding protein
MTDTSLAKTNPFGADSRDALRGGGDAQPILTVTDLKKYFPIRTGMLGGKLSNVHAVDGVSFSIEKGETLGVVGESGCGKSTLARLLMYLIPKTSGEVVFDGELVAGLHGISVRDLRHRMQMVFQDSYSSLNPRLPVVDSIAYGPSAHGMARRQAKELARTLLDRVGLRPDLYASRYPHELSGGQKQRVNIARALALNPRLVILDEAVSALDKSVEAQVLNLLRLLKRELKLTYLFISHDLDVVQYISDRVLVMYLGQVVEIGPVDEVYGRPRHPYTRALLNSRLGTDPAQRVKEAPLVGDPPNPIDLPSGCRFRTRCPFAEQVCIATAPALTKPNEESGHEIACHMANPASGHSRASVNDHLVN